jgi:hypothetical protein
MLMMLFIALMPISLWAQNRAITGIVTDETNESVTRASVVD